MIDASRPVAGDDRVAELRAAVEALGGQADRRAAEIEELRRLPADLSSALVDTGLGRAWAPARYGGLELPVLELLDALESLATFEAGTAWCGMIAATTSLLGGYLPERWAEEIYGDPRAITGGHAAPQGRARPVEGGLLVSGHWQWGSGSFHCTWIGGGTVVVDDAGAPAPRADGLRAPVRPLRAGPGRAARHLVHDGAARFGQHRLRGARGVRPGGSLGRDRRAGAGRRRPPLPVPLLRGARPRRLLHQPRPRPPRPRRGGGAGRRASATP